MPPGFSDPTQWPNLKSAAALAEFFGGLIPDPAGSGAMKMLGAGLSGSGSGMVDAIKGMVPDIAAIAAPDIGDIAAGVEPDAAHAGAGARTGQGGPSVVVNGDVGMDPRQFTQRIDAHQNQAWRKNSGGMRR
jgi:hypothetical protein